MPDHFPRAVALVLEREGALSDDRYDPGGLTKYGISQRAYPNLDIAALTKDKAVGIYLADYWLACRCDSMPWWAALIVFDCAVNQGAWRATRLIQEAVGVAQDGIVGPRTLAAIERRDPAEGIALFQALRAMHYAGLRTWPRYGQGWMRRAHLITQEAARPFAMEA